MSTRESRNDHDKDRERHDLLVFLLLLLLGFACLMITAQVAVQPARKWSGSADMLSRLNPNENADATRLYVEPLSDKALTPWDPNHFLTPRGTAGVVPTMVVGPALTGTPREAAEAPTLSPSATSTLRTPTPTLTGTPTPTPTLTGTPTPTSTPTPTPTGTPTPTSTPTGTPTATSTSTPVPPTHTSLPPRPTTASPTQTYTPTPTVTPTPTPVPPPSIFSITPEQGVRSAPVPVVIRGANFFGVPTATLRTGVSITISDATADTLTGTVPAGLVPGVYALSVTNPDGQSDILSPAYIALNPPSPNTTLETGYVSTFGTAATSPSNGDNDQVQVIFLEIPDTVTNMLYVRIFDPDVGGPPGGEYDEQQGAGWDTATTFSLYGGSGAYTNPAARHATFATTADPGISTGTWIISQTFVVSDTLNGTWYTFATVNPSQGETVGNKRVFKLSVVGANSGDDGNVYNVALSTDPLTNVAPAGSRVFAYSWTFLLATDPSQRPPLYPYVPSGTASFEQHNWDMDYVDGTMTLYTPMRDLVIPGSDISGDDVEAQSSHTTQDGEHGTTWTVTMEFSFGGGPWNDVTFWAVGNGTDLPIFTHPTMDPLP